MFDTIFLFQGGALINVDHAVRNGASATCVFCSKKGATIHCHRSRCANIYHCACAIECGCHFFKVKCWKAIVNISIALYFLSGVLVVFIIIFV